MKVQNFRPLLQFFGIVLLIVLISCQSKSTEKNKSKDPEKQVESNSFFTIPFAEIIKHKREVPLSEIAESVEFIPLENTAESMIGNVMDVKLTKDFIFVKHNGTRLITQFSNDGKFIRHIGTEGRGPKEYGLARMFSLDEKNQMIYIHTNWTRKILVYNFDGEYVKTLKFGNIGRGHFTWSRDNFLVSFSEPHLGNEPNIFIETNFQGDTMQTTKNHIFWDKKGERSFTVSYWGRNAFYWAENKLHMKGWYNDTVYTYNDMNEFVPKFFVDLGEHKIPDDLIPEKMSQQPLHKKYYWVGLNESKNYVFIRFGEHMDLINREKQLEEGCIIYDKRSGKGKALKNDNGECGFLNDFRGGPNFKPLFSNDTLIFVDVSALDMKTHLDSNEFKNLEVKFPDQKEKLAELNRTLKEDDNHFLMLAKLK